VTATQLKAARKTLGLTQEQLAAALDVHRVTIARWETDAEPIPRVIALAMEALRLRAKRRRRPRA
jgi:DNA-binding XRE family transcriptional regulator